MQHFKAKMFCQKRDYKHSVILIEFTRQRWFPGHHQAFLLGICLKGLKNIKPVVNIFIFRIPGDSYLEEVSSNWTAINTYKEYQCQGKNSEGEHTRYFEYDRNRSSFKMLCLDNGNYDFKNERKNWPTCLKGTQNKYHNDTEVFKIYKPLLLITEL